MNRRLIKIVFLLAAFLLLNGCARFQGNEVDVSHFAPPVQKNKPQIITYTLEGNVPDKEEQYLKQVFADYGWQLEWGPSRNDGSPHMTINYNFRRNGAAVVAALFTGLTLYAIPSWQTQKYELKAIVTDGKNFNRGYKSDDHTTLVQWLPMMFAFPFAFPFTAESKLTEKLYIDLAYRLTQDWASQVRSENNALMQ